MKYPLSFDINLWSVESKWSRLFRRPYLLIAGVIILAGLLGGSIIGWYHFCESRQIQRIAALENQVAVRSGQAETEVGALEKRVAQLKAELQTLEKNRLDLPGLLAQVQVAIPPGVILQEVFMTEDRLICRGSASEYPQVAQYMMSLEKGEYLNEPICNLAETRREIIHFDILLKISSEGRSGK